MPNSNEKAIVRTIVNDSFEMGYYINIDNGGDSLELELPTRNLNLIMDTLFATDEEFIIFYEFEEQSKKYKKIGMVYLVYGNDYDVISNYSIDSKTEKILHNAQKLADKMALS